MKTFTTDINGWQSPVPHYSIVRLSAIYTFIVGFILICMASTSLAQPKMIVTDSVNNKLYQYTLDGSDPIELGNSSGHAFGNRVKIVGTADDPEIIFLSSDGKLVHSKFENPIPDPLRAIVLDNPRAIGRFNPNYLYIPNSGLKLTRVGEDQSISDLFDSENMVDMVPCGGLFMCVVHRTSKIARVNMITGQATLRPAGIGGLAYIAYSQARHELLIVNASFSEIYSLDMNDFPAGELVTLYNSSNGLTQPTQIEVLSDDSDTNISFAVIQNSGSEIAYFSYQRGVTAPQDPSGVIQANGKTFSDLSSIITDSSGGSTQCNDGLDNDEDGAIDLVDPGCSDAEDDDETDTGDCDSKDSDGDGTEDCADECPNDAIKVKPGVCGCSTEDSIENLSDLDEDGVVKCLDACPSNGFITIEDQNCAGDCTSLRYPDNSCLPAECPDSPGYIYPGCSTCDEIPNDDASCSEIEDCSEGACEDLCPDDNKKNEPGDCGCGIPDFDSDGDGTLDCFDLCVANGFLTEPGLCGCDNVNEVVLTSSSNFSAAASTFVCSAIPDISDGMDIPKPFVSMKVKKKNVILTVNFERFRIPDTNSVLAARRKGKRNSKRKFVEYRVNITSLDPKSNKTKRLVKKTRKQKFKTKVKKGSLVYVNYQANIKRGNRNKSKTIASTNPSRPTVLIAR